MELEVCWHGALWRTIEAPVPVAPEPKRINPRKPVDPVSCEARILEVLTNEWQSASAVRERAGMQHDYVAPTLRRLVKHELVELRIVASTYRGRPQKLYRRRAQARTEAA